MYKYQEDDHLGLHISIGDFDCDDCGWTSENLEVRVKIENNKPVENTYSTSMTLGCYGGFSNYDQNREDTLDKLVSLRAEYPFNNEKSVLKDLNKIIKSIEQLEA